MSDTTTLPLHEIVVAVPARDEQARIGDCLRALALQQGAHRHAILVLLNNCSDGSANIVEALRPTLPCPVYVIEHSFPPSQANAGQARRLAMHRACERVRPGGVLMTTDADGRVAPDWIEASMAALAAGADVVCGRAIIDADDAALIPTHLHDDDALECAYGELLDEIHALLDPDPADPWPRHTEHSGASIALTREMFLRAGGIPEVAVGEDRAFLAALRRVDARIRHAPELVVTVSGRLDGRANGGMADTIRRRVVRQDPLLDDRLEPAADCARRAQARYDLRAFWNAPEAATPHDLAARLEISVSDLNEWLRLPFFGAAWAEVEAASPHLRRRPVIRRDIEVSMEAAEKILAAGFNWPARRSRAEHPAGNPAAANASPQAAPQPL